jgi:hypothetical protein
MEEFARLHSILQQLALSYKDHVFTLDNATWQTCDASWLQLRQHLLSSGGWVKLQTPEGLSTAIMDLESHVTNVRLRPLSSMLT